VSESCLAKIDQDGSGTSDEPKDVEISTRGGATQSVTSETVVGEADEVTTDEAVADEAVVDEAVVDEASAETDVPEIRSTSTTANLSSESEKACQLQLVCLPGNSSPVVMMMCSEESATVAEAEAADGATAPLPAPEVDTTPKEVTWAWSAEEEETVVVETAGEAETEVAVESAEAEVTDVVAEKADEQEADITTETAAP
jgi:hypothetical protein